MRFEKLETRLDGPLYLQPRVFGDERGFFTETFRRNEFEQLGIAEDFVQDNHSRSARGTVRGMHFQIGAGASKLVRCGRGAIVDVLVDLRRGSPSYGEWEASNYYSDDVERGISFRDPAVGIRWPLPDEELLVSERDRTAPSLSEVADDLPFEYAAAR